MGRGLHLHPIFHHKQCQLCMVKQRLFRNLYIYSDKSLHAIASRNSFKYLRIGLHMRWNIMDSHYTLHCASYRPRHKHYKDAIRSWGMSCPCFAGIACAVILRQRLAGAMCAGCRVEYPLINSACASSSNGAGFRARDIGLRSAAA